MLRDLRGHIRSAEFAEAARGPDCAGAFTRRSKLPLPILIAALLCQRNQARQAGLDHFFGNLADHAAPEHVASNRAFARVRSRLRSGALTDLNDRLVERAAAMAPSWRGLRVVAADASVLATEAAQLLCYQTC